MTGPDATTHPNGRTGVLVMAHGTPDRPEDLESFYTRIRRGRPPSPDQLAELRSRYDAIGGISPLSARTAAQVRGIAAALEAARPGAFTVGFGAKHVAPFIEDAAADLAASGVSRVVGLVLTPHRASMGSDEYLERAAAALEGAGASPPLVPVRQWFDAPGFADLIAARVRGALATLPADRPRTVFFTAHSLPARVLETGDPYPEQVAASAAAAAAAAGLDADGVRWGVSWQSAGRTPEPWIGPDILDELRRLGAGESAGGVVICPIGFVSDHLEVLYDVDIEARQVAGEARLAFDRTASLNDDPRFCELLARVVRDAADRHETPHG